MKRAFLFGVSWYGWIGIVALVISGHWSWLMLLALAAMGLGAWLLAVRCRPNLSRAHAIGGWLLGFIVGFAGFNGFWIAVFAFIYAINTGPG